MKCQSDKIRFVTQSQLIGCLLVVLGHSIPLSWNVPSIIYNIDVFIYTFHMPLFFFISGYLFEKTASYSRYDFRAYVLKRNNRLMIPYFTMTLIGFIPKIIMNRFFEDDSSLNILYFIKCFLVPRDNVWEHFWFLPTLFIISMLSFVFSKIKHLNGNVYCVFSVLLLCLSIIPNLVNITEWFAVNDIIRFVGYYAVGIMFANTKFELLLSNNNSCYKLLLLFAISIGLFLISINNKIFLQSIRTIIALLMIMVILTFSSLVNFTSNKIGLYLSRKTYSIFILSWPFQSIVSVVFEKVLGLKYYITMPLSFISGVLGPVIVIFLVDLLEKKIGKRIISPIIGG